MQPDRETWGMSLTFTPEKVVWRFDTAQGPKVHDGIYRFDPRKSPWQLDLREPESRAPEPVGLGICRLEGDTLTIHIDGQRPGGFSQDVLWRLVLKRE